MIFFLQYLNLEWRRMTFGGTTSIVSPSYARVRIFPAKSSHPPQNQSLITVILTYYKLSELLLFLLLSRVSRWTNCCRWDWRYRLFRTPVDMNKVGSLSNTPFLPLIAGAKPVVKGPDQPAKAKTEGGRRCTLTFLLSKWNTIWTAFYFCCRRGSWGGGPKA